tara:strand:- start:13639 stop:14031 length:393 start_codon:yes stop_codon:yes gene_type:complete
MKDAEKQILDKINLECRLSLKADEYEYNRFDAEDERYIVEIKDRHKFYKDTMIEFDKYSYNLVYSQVANKDFIYAVRMESNIYIFNLTKKDCSYNWEWRDMPRQTEFGNTEKIKKLVGFLDIENSVRIIG